MTGIPDEFWWPSPEAFDDLTVVDIEEGFELSAPDDTELAEWLSYWSQNEERHELFQTVFVKTLTDHATAVLEQFNENGKAEIQSDEQSGDREQAEEECTGAVS